MTIQQKVNAAFCNIIAESNLTNKEIATIIEVDPSLITHFRTRYRNVSIDHLEKLAKHLNMKVQININLSEIEWFYN
jgi:predicted XRE-type DNA-binding protein